MAAEKPMTLAEEKCSKEYASGPPLDKNSAARLKEEVPGWTLNEGAIEREFRFKDFKDAMVFVNRVASVADSEDHHPDICIYYSRVRLTLSTHKAGGLTRNDFILAARIDGLL